MIIKTICKILTSTFCDSEPEPPPGLPPGWTLHKNELGEYMAKYPSGTPTYVRKTEKQARADAWRLAALYEREKKSAKFTQIEPKP